MTKRIPMRDFLAKRAESLFGFDMYVEGLIPAIHRVLNDPEDTEFPLMPDEHGDGAIIYWEGACYVMLGLLGWTNPAKGLLWWYDQKQNTLGDKRLSALNELWNDRQHLDLLAAWFWTRNNHPLNWEAMTRHASRELCPPVHFSPGTDWWEDFRRRFKGKTPPSVPYSLDSVGSNNLHLLHLSSPWADAPESTKLLRPSRDRPRARLVLDQPTGWLTALSTHAGRLGMLGWSVDVVVKRWGWLGTFRRSPLTGLWYQGPHHVHLAGNLHPQGERWGDEEYFSEYDAPKVAADVTGYMERETIRPAALDESLSFQFQVGEVRRSGKGQPRTVMGYGYNPAGEPVYIVRIDGTEALTAKRAWKAHKEYGPLMGIDDVQA
jgi:hypothetical protein